MNGYEGSIVEAIFDGYNKTFHFYESYLLVSRGNGTVKIKCRGSDAVGISLFTKIPIKVNTAFLGREKEKRKRERIGDMK